MKEFLFSLTHKFDKHNSALVLQYTNIHRKSANTLDQNISKNLHTPHTVLLKHSVILMLVSVVLLSHVLLLLVHVPLIVFLHYGLYVDLSVPLT